MQWMSTKIKTRKEKMKKKKKKKKEQAKMAMVKGERFPLTFQSQRISVGHLVLYMHISLCNSSNISFEFIGYPARINVLDL